MINFSIETEPEGHIKIVYGVERVRELEAKEKTRIQNKKKNKVQKNKTKKK